MTGASDRPSRAGFHQPARAELARDALQVAPTLLGGLLSVRVDDATVTVTVQGFTTGAPMPEALPGLTVTAATDPLFAVRAILP